MRAIECDGIKKMSSAFKVTISSLYCFLIKCLVYVNIYFR